FPTPYFAMLLGLHPARNAKTFELITVCQVLAAHVAMIVKHHLAIRRPDRIGATVLPMIPTPGHGAFPSAHATEAFAVAHLLAGLVDATGSHYPDPDKRKNLLFKQAERISVSRTVAGVHYPIDSWAGALLGKMIAEIILNKCGITNTMTGLKYAAKGDSDFMLSQYKDPVWKDHGVSELSNCDVAKSELFEWLWLKAVDEFKL
ncbi:MAG: phosphatase PAP2 family protein, partial [Pseudomonadota bacterium]